MEKNIEKLSQSFSIISYLGERKFKGRQPTLHMGHVFAICVAAAQSVTMTKLDSCTSQNSFLHIYYEPHKTIFSQYIFKFNPASKYFSVLFYIDPPPKVAKNKQLSYSSCVLRLLRYLQFYIKSFRRSYFSESREAEIFAKIRSNINFYLNSKIIIIHIIILFLIFQFH